MIFFLFLLRASEGSLKTEFESGGANLMRRGDSLMPSVVGGGEIRREELMTSEGGELPPQA